MTNKEQGHGAENAVASDGDLLGDDPAENTLTASPSQAALPRPPVPTDLDLSGTPSIMVDIARMMKSRTWLRFKRRPELILPTLSLYFRAFHETPAGSVEDDDDVLFDAAGCPVNWPNLKPTVMAGWTLCGDGRWYHAVVVEKALERHAGVIAYAFKLAEDRRRQAAHRAGDKSSVPLSFAPWLAREYPSSVEYVETLRPFWPASLRDKVMTSHGHSGASHGKSATDVVTGAARHRENGLEYEKEVEGEHQSEPSTSFSNETTTSPPLPGPDGRAKNAEVSLEEAAKIAAAILGNFGANGAARG